MAGVGTVHGCVADALLPRDTVAVADEDVER
jgi:hypothetical protein